MSDIKVVKTTESKKVHTIKAFCKKYNDLKSTQAKGALIASILKKDMYVPFVMKDALMSNIVKCTMLDKETGNIKVNSSAEYLLLIRVFIEQYTYLKVETPGFFEEYDELVKSGLFDLLIVGNENIEPLIPRAEITEFKNLLNLKKNDLMTNQYEPHAFITCQVDRFIKLGKATLSPVVDAITKKIEGLSNEDIADIAVKLQSLMDGIESGTKKSEK